MGEKPIDFVLLWVDGKDKEWQKQRNQYAGKESEDMAEYRFRDWDLLRYWFRGVETFAPWVNHIYFVTCGQCPEWLNRNHSKLKLINHTDFIPKEYLPTFNANTIELNLHRIKGLSEQFVFFNDDMFLINAMKREDFFDQDIPKYVAGLDLNDSNNGIFSYILLNDMQYLLKDKKQEFHPLRWIHFQYTWKTNLKTLLLSPFHFLSVLRNPHMPVPMRKSDLEALWNEKPEELEKTSRNKFRSREDINQYVISWNRILEGTFQPAKEKNGRYFEIKADGSQIKEAIQRQKYRMLCLNDSSDLADFETIQQELQKSFEVILPKKSEFECDHDKNQ